MLYYTHQQKFFQSIDKALKKPFYTSIELIVLTQRKTKCFAMTGNTMIVFPSTSLNYNCFGQIRKKIGLTTFLVKKLLNLSDSLFNI
jgi:hypothetical protein